jgi:hypothetical protein
VLSRRERCLEQLSNTSNSSDNSSGTELDGQARSSASVWSQSRRRHGNTSAVLRTIGHRGRSTGSRGDGDDSNHRRRNSRAGSDSLNCLGEEFSGERGRGRAGGNGSLRGRDDGGLRGGNNGGFEGGLNSGSSGGSASGGLDDTADGEGGVVGHDRGGIIGLLSVGAREGEQQRKKDVGELHCG